MSEDGSEPRGEFSRPLIEQIELTPVDSKGALVVSGGYEIPAPRHVTLWRRWHDFLSVVIAPVIVAAVYLFAVASNRYVSETKYIVRSGGGSSLAGVTSLVQTQGLSRATDENYVVNEYIKSRDIVSVMAERDHLRDLFDRPEADLFSRFPNFYSRNDLEHLFKRYLSAIDVSLDETAGITTLRAIAYRGEDARNLASLVMTHADAFINKLNDRAHDDELQYAQMIVDKAREKTADVEAKLTLFRNAHGTVDPGRELLASLELISRLSEQQAKFEAALSRQMTLTPSSPSNDSLKDKIQSYKDEIAKLKSGVVGGAGSTASSLSAYELLVLERQLSAKSLEAAVLNFERAREEAQQKHLYIETVAEPSLADTPEYPRRFLDLLISALVAGGVWVIQRSLRINASEHGS